MTLTKKRNNGHDYPAFPSLSGWVDSFFDDKDGLFGNWPRTWNRSNAMPAANVSETETEYTVELATPGMAKDDFKVEIDQNMLMVSSDSKTENEEKTDSYTRREFSFQSFQRKFWLPENVDTSKVAAKYDEGILRIVLPKTEPTPTITPRKISVS